VYSHRGGAFTTEFTVHYPKLEVHLSLADRHVDLIEEKIDVAIQVGRLADSSLIARKIGEMRRVIVASPLLTSRSMARQRRRMIS
jgi:LysR family transcriptional regulator for bpeEF and oprC